MSNCEHISYISYGSYKSWEPKRPPYGDLTLFKMASLHSVQGTPTDGMPEAYVAPIARLSISVPSCPNPSFKLRTARQDRGTYGITDSRKSPKPRHGLKGTHSEREPGKLRRNRQNQHLPRFRFSLCVPQKCQSGEAQIKNLS